MAGLQLQAGKLVYVDAQGRVHQTKLGPHGVVYQTTSGMWAAPPSAAVAAVAAAQKANPWGAPAASAAPAAPAVPAPDPVYDAEILAAQRTRTNALTDLTGTRRRTLADYGFTETTDPVTGQPTGVTNFDPNNPFSRAALLKKNYNNQRARTAGSMAAAGQMYAGAFNQARNIVNRGQLAAEDQLQKSLQDFLARNTSGAAAAQTTYETSAAAAEGNRLARLLSS